jgi:tetratricopeptide (TPR) repeat protein
MPRPFCAVVATLLIALPAAQAADAPRRPESQQEYWAQVDRKDWSAAIAAAEQLVAEARNRTPPQPLALAEALSLLGNAQFGSQDYGAAEKTFEEALQIVDQNVGAAGHSTS